MAVTLSPFGEEFGLIEHQLRIQLKAPHCVIKEMQNISLKSNVNAFSNLIRTMENPNIVDVFFEISQLGQSAHDITNAGVRIPTKAGFKFCPSKLVLPPKQDEYVIVHCVIALGKVHNNIAPLDSLDGDKYLPCENLTAANKPANCDSLRVSDDDEFMIFKPNQINTVHLLKVAGGENVMQKELDCLICDNCHKEQAIVYCPNDQMKLCGACDKKVHNVSEITKKHERKPLGEALPNFQNCPEHPGNKVQYYCPICHLPLCMECKVSGSHSHRDTLKHKLIPIAEAYKRGGDIINSPNKIRIAREKALTSAIIEAEEKVSALHKGLDAMLAEIRRIAAAAELEAKTLTGERIVETKSALSELQRKFNLLKSQKDLLIDYYQNGEPIHFLQTLHRNELLDQDIQTNIDLQKASSIKADLGVYGHLQISCPKAKEIVQPVAERAISVGKSHSTWSTATSTKTATNEDEDYLRLVKFTTLDKVAEKKLKKYAETGRQLTIEPFEGSEIIEDEEIARKLYLSFPFKAVPETHLIFSTEQDGRDIKKMHKLIDGKGISVILVKVGEHIFGGFAASKWNNESVPFGEGSSSFLFSIDRNAFIPARPKGDSIYLLGTPDSVSFGGDDLVIGGNFDRCASTLEHTFGIGLEPGSEAAQNFLAGAPRFKADCVEVWGFFSPAN